MKEKVRDQACKRNARMTVILFQTETFCLRPIQISYAIKQEPKQRCYEHVFYER
jgi:hypothetical protein